MKHLAEGTTSGAPARLSSIASAELQRPLLNHDDKPLLASSSTHYHEGLTTTSLPSGGSRLENLEAEQQTAETAATAKLAGTSTAPRLSHPPISYFPASDLDQAPNDPTAALTSTAVWAFVVLFVLWIRASWDEAVLYDSPKIELALLLIVLFLQAVPRILESALQPFGELPDLWYFTAKLQPLLLLSFSVYSAFFLSKGELLSALQNVVVLAFVASLDTELLEQFVGWRFGGGGAEGEEGEDGKGMLCVLRSEDASVADKWGVLTRGPCGLGILDRAPKKLAAAAAVSKAAKEYGQFPLLSQASSVISQRIFSIFHPYTFVHSYRQSRELSIAFVGDGDACSRLEPVCTAVNLHVCVFSWADVGEQVVEECWRRSAGGAGGGSGGGGDSRTALPPLSLLEGQVPRASGGSGSGGSSRRRCDGGGCAAPVLASGACLEWFLRGMSQQQWADELDSATRAALVRCFPEYVERFPLLSPFDGDFRDLNLGPHHVRAIAEMLTHSPDISILDLSGNPSIGDAGILYLAEALRFAPSLDELILDDVGMSDAGARALLDVLSAQPAALRMRLSAAANQAVSESLLAELHGKVALPAQLRRGGRTRRRHRRRCGSNGGGDGCDG
ncbi:hypothetical protein VOLCADRAFT_91047 [Volvox carteri f. nagariensis]|uniref:Uncharacterized protein n=1 Tax=Volvox carteri f. nagariensis TaxID=3068 RepID=D8TW16_VOLCA|nr:uncharacterized protein VOLCADRAFT_91047 [Volvox carteri f. nagariensis]EFJ48400.1 hypothetical protein VOLCADRAFT_91047 [Volvox carteri f. nagariensis]|eukprot:XP_002950654.1 hypothetical protein VOLCADRAFT_91047 [Volvox carteri f. nagariensis]